MATTKDGGDDGREPPHAPAVDFAQYRARRVRMRLLELLDALVVAIERRDLQSVWDVLDEEEAARWFPAGLREEAVAIARLSPSSLRAPVRVYRYYHQLQQLGDEPLDLEGDPRQLSLELGPPATGRPGGAVDRRRTGSR
jgi:hypothetical protein